MGAGGSMKMIFDNEAEKQEVVNDLTKLRELFIAQLLDTGLFSSVVGLMLIAKHSEVNNDPA
jgi:hypothetical protein